MTLRSLLLALALGAAAPAAATHAAAAQAAPAFSTATFTPAGAAPAGFDRAAAQRTTETHLRNLVRLNTQNPPGNEMLVARYFDSVFKQIPGVETHVLPVGNGRANFIARLRSGRPVTRSVLVMGHMDVVGADTTKWTTRPFEATLLEPYLHGRGTIDDKGMLSAAAAAMAQLAARRATLTRDVVFLGTADEEGGDTVGVERVVSRHWPLIQDAEFALNEGGRIRIVNGRVHTVNIQTTEKVSYTVIATATGPSGHGSVPLPNNALAALARAAARVHEWRAPAKLNETTRLYFERLSTIEQDEQRRAAMLRLLAPGASDAAVREAADVLARDPLYNAVLRTAASLTMIGGGFRSNVIPSEGTATFNVRAMPGDDILRVVREMQLAGGEASVTFALRGAPEASPPPSPVTTALYRAMETSARAMVPTATVIPFMSTGATDGAVLRAKGIPTYGILPMPLPLEDELRMHGDNERVPVRALGWAAEYLYRVLDGVTQPPAPRR
jgi:acetylornithine deacetylase/succinyl-diaminopimelate desuccinylase-like protein